MKNLNNIQEMKQFSIALQKFLKDNSIDVKHSLMLEGLAKSMDLPDWNTLSSVLQKSNNTNSTLDYSKFSKDTEKVIRIGQQTIFLQYDNDLNILLIGVENENTSCSVFLKFNNTKLFEKLSISLFDYMNFKCDSEKRPEYEEATFEGDNSKIILNIVNNTLSFESPVNQLIINNLNKINVTKQILQFFNDNSNNTIKTPRFIYPLTDSLLSNMAMRYDHSYGLWAQDEPERAEKLLQKLRDLHTLFSQNLSNEEITRQLKIDSVSVSQLREEVEGDGFYNPSTKDNSSKYPHKMFANKG